MRYKYSRKEIAGLLSELHFDKRAYDITCKLLATNPLRQERQKSYQEGFEEAIEKEIGCDHDWRKISEKPDSTSFTRQCVKCGIFLAPCYQCGGDSVRCNCGKEIRQKIKSLKKEKKYMDDVVKMLEKVRDEIIGDGEWSDGTVDRNTKEQRKKIDKMIEEIKK